MATAKDQDSGLIKRAPVGLMGMLLVMLAVQMFLDGVAQFWAGLAT